MGSCAEVVDDDPLGLSVPEVAAALQELVLVGHSAILEVKPAEGRSPVTRSHPHYTNTVMLCTVTRKA